MTFSNILHTHTHTHTYIYIYRGACFTSHSLIAADDYGVLLLRHLDRNGWAGLAGTRELHRRFGRGRRRVEHDYCDAGGLEERWQAGEGVRGGCIGHHDRWCGHQLRGPGRPSARTPGVRQLCAHPHHQPVRHRSVRLRARNVHRCREVRSRLSLQS